MNDQRLGVRWANFLLWNCLEHEKVKCSKCEGKGWVEPNPKDYAHYTLGPIWWVENCSKCHGDGVIQIFTIPFEDNLIDLAYGRI